MPRAPVERIRIGSSGHETRALLHLSHPGLSQSGSKQVSRFSDDVSRFHRAPKYKSQPTKRTLRLGPSDSSIHFPCTTLGDNSRVKGEADEGQEADFRKISLLMFVSVALCA